MRKYEELTDYELGYEVGRLEALQETKSKNSLKDIVNDNSMDTDEHINGLKAPYKWSKPKTFNLNTVIIGVTFYELIYEILLNAKEYKKIKESKNKIAMAEFIRNRYQDLTFRLYRDSEGWISDKKAISQIMSEVEKYLN